MCQMPWGCDTVGKINCVICFYWHVLNGHNFNFDHTISQHVSSVCSSQTLPSLYRQRFEPGIFSFSVQLISTRQCFGQLCYCSSPTIPPFFFNQLSSTRLTYIKVLSVLVGRWQFRIDLCFIWSNWISRYLLKVNAGWTLIEKRS